MRVFIDPGHGGADPGATFNDLIEKDICLEVSLRIAAGFKGRGHFVEMSRKSDFFVNLQRRPREANDWAADVFLSIHLNADPDPDDPGMPEAKGSEFWIYPGSFKGRRVAESINLQMAKQLPAHPRRGVKEANFAVLRLTKMPAVLLELAFIDTVTSTRLRESNVQDRFALAVVDGVQDYFDSLVGVV